MTQSTAPDTRESGQLAADVHVAPRERILQAVIDGLPDLDPATLTIQQVCERAQVTAPTIYYHFGSKEGMVAASVEALVARWLAQLEASVDRAGSLDEMLRQTRAAWVAMIVAPSRPLAVFVWLAMWSEASRPTLMHARERAHELIVDALTAHLGPSPDMDDLARLLLDGLLGASVDYQLDRDATSLQRRLETLLTVVTIRAAANANPITIRTDPTHPTTATRDPR